MRKVKKQIRKQENNKPEDTRKGKRTQSAENLPMYTHKHKNRTTYKNVSSVEKKCYVLQKLLNRLYYIAQTYI